MDLRNPEYRKAERMKYTQSITLKERLIDLVQAEIDEDYQSLQYLKDCGEDDDDEVTIESKIGVRGLYIQLLRRDIRILEECRADISEASFGNFDAMSGEQLKELASLKGEE